MSAALRPRRRISVWKRRGREVIAGSCGGAKKTADPRRDAKGHEGHEGDGRSAIQIRPYVGVAGAMASARECTTAELISSAVVVYSTLQGVLYRLGPISAIKWSEVDPSAGGRCPGWCVHHPPPGLCNVLTIIGVAFPIIALDIYYQIDGAIPACDAGPIRSTGWRPSELDIANNRTGSISDIGRPIGLCIQITAGCLRPRAITPRFSATRCCCHWRCWQDKAHPGENGEDDHCGHESSLKHGSILSLVMKPMDQVVGRGWVGVSVIVISSRDHDARAC
jgi:hypothetical protein